MITERHLISELESVTSAVDRSALMVRDLMETSVVDGWTWDAAAARSMSRSHRVFEEVAVDIDRLARRVRL